MPNTKARKLLALSYLRVALVVMFVGVLPMGGLIYWTGHQNLMRACERTNVLRSVTDGLLTTAQARAISQDQAGFAQEYARLRETLRSVDHTYEASSIINCPAAIN